MAESKGAGGSRTGRPRRLQEEQANRKIREELRKAIRSVWTKYSEERKQVLWEARVTKKRYNKDGSISKVPDVYTKCAECGELVKEAQVDHIEPVGKTPDFPPTVDSVGWVNWLLRLFCSTDNLRAICKRCHLLKSNTEKRPK